MKRNLGKKLMQGLKVAGTATLFLGLMGLYQMKFKDVWKQQSEMKELIENSPRTSYVVKEGDNLYNLRDKFFEVGKEEFKELDRNDFAQNWNNVYGGYKSLTATNLWTSIVRNENNLPLKECLKNMYFIQEGDTLSVPFRNVKALEGKINQNYLNSSLFNKRSISKHHTHWIGQN